MVANLSTARLDASRVEAIRRLNDDLRVYGRGGRIMVTAGFAALPPLTQAHAFRAIRAFAAFTPDNDPYREHDFGSVIVNDDTILWKIDTYDRSLSVHSPDAAEPKVTERVLNIMLAEEY